MRAMRKFFHRWMQCTLLLAALPALGQSDTPAASPSDIPPRLDQTLADWPKLIAAKRCEDARNLCTAYVYSVDTSGRVGAQKCLAEADICAGNNLQDALMHLNVALRMAPQDISVHMARLHTLQKTGNFAMMPQALEESSNIYKGSDALQSWLRISEELMDARQYSTGLDFTRVMDRHYPNQAQVLGDMGMFASAMGKNDDAIAYLKRATSLAPKDETITWEMARVYDNANQIDLANRWYKKSLPMTRSAHQLMENSCVYAMFVETKLHDRQHACQMERMSCEIEQQTACAPQPASVSKSK